MKKQILFFVLAAAFCLSAVPNSLANECGIQGMDVICCQPGQECPKASPTPPIASQSFDTKRDTDVFISASAGAVIPKSKNRSLFEYLLSYFW
ncbi:MAG: hypothetical protein M3209_09740 [Acidobacteriota bacterium]|nr:hypothetical protein [Acidobacteriota bacterium]